MTKIEYSGINAMGKMNRCHGRRPVRRSLLAAVPFGHWKTMTSSPARTIDTLWQRTRIILDSFTPKDCTNYFQEAGYGHSM